MPVLFLHIVALLITLLIFGSVGYRLSKRIKSPVSAVTWILLVLFTLLAGSFMRLGILLGIFEFKIYAPYSLMALGIGILIGLGTREIRLRTRVSAKV
jgi:hypothetical protein